MAITLAAATDDRYKPYSLETQQEAVTVLLEFARRRSQIVLDQVASRAVSVRTP